jgi:hypothetical protein
MAFDEEETIGSINPAEGCELRQDQFLKLSAIIA